MEHTAGEPLRLAHKAYSSSSWTEEMTETLSQRNSTMDKEYCILAVVGQATIGFINTKFTLSITHMQA